MPYLIDSDWVIDHLNEVAEAMRLLNDLADDGIAMSIVTYMEVYQGLERSPDRQAAEARLDNLFAMMPIIPFSVSVARCCARLRESLRRQGRRVTPRALDLIIAATALEHGLTLVTRNRDDYNDIPNLKLYPG